MLYISILFVLSRNSLLTNSFLLQGQAVALINYGNALDFSRDYEGALEAFRQAYE